MFLWDKGGTGIRRVILGLDVGQVNLIGIALAVALLTDTQFLCQLFPGEDNENLALIIDPAVPVGELEAVQEKGVGDLASRLMSE